jgi:LuxR family transcriptional regulator, maltose regulon positive regulatory protein
MSYFLAGDVDTADAIWAHAVDVSVYFGAWPAAAGASALRATIAIERRDWTAARSLVERALAIDEAAHLEHYSHASVVYAAAARTCIHDGNVVEARAHVARAARLRPLLTYALPWSAAFLLEIGRVYLELADAAGARAVVREVREILQMRPKLGVIPQQAAELESLLDTIKASTVGASSLTAAELRLLPYLATHLSFREIGERIHVSRHTVKSQAMSVYRKLGVSSRSAAIERMHDTGLLPT